MNRTFLSIFVLLSLFVFGMVASAFGEANWVSLNGTSSPAKPNAVVQSSNESETIVKFTVPGFWMEEVLEESDTYQTLRFPGYAGCLHRPAQALPHPAHSSPASRRRHPSRLRAVTAAQQARLRLNVLKNGRYP